MRYPIRAVGVISEGYRERLREAGIRNTEQLLRACSDGCGRGAVAGATGIAVKLLHQWANIVDLMRVRGVGQSYAELLVDAGVCSVDVLRSQDCELLAVRLAVLHQGRGFPGAPPTVALVADWTEQAKALSPTVSH